MGSLWNYLFPSEDMVNAANNQKRTTIAEGLVDADEKFASSDASNKSELNSQKSGSDTPSGTLKAETDTGSKKKKLDKSSSKGKQSDEHLYRDCGHIRTKRLDLDLPNIDQSELKPIESHVPECFNLKLEYEKCFLHWFSHKFLKGSTNFAPCDALLKKYTDCVKKGLKEQNVNLYPPNCLHYSADPDIRKVERPRKKPPPGATPVHP